FQTNCAKPDYECWSLGNLYTTNYSIKIEEVKIANIGNGDAGATEVCVMLSTDKAFSNLDYIVKRVQLPALSANGGMYKFDLEIPFYDIDLSAGDYYVGFWIDCDDNVMEISEYNNVCHFNNKVTITKNLKPDLECWDRGDITIDDWDIVINNIKITNQGNGESTPTEVCVVLSTDLTFGDGDDITVDELYLPALSPNEMAILNANVELMNLDIPADKYYIGLVIDCNDKVWETDEYNNVCYWSNPYLEIPDDKKPDLECWYRGDITIDDWDIVIKDIKITNQGMAKSSSTQVCVVLSTDLTFGDSDDMILEYLPLTDLDPNEMAVLNANIELMDKNLPSGKYYVGLVIDCSDKVMESDEYNNICYWSDPYLEIKDKKKPDLECWDRGDITIDDWDIVINDIKVANLGEAESNITEVCIVLSTDLNFDDNDMVLEELYLPKLSPNEMAVLNANIELMDKNLAPGKYYVGIVIDCNDKIMETNENNNICYWSNPYLEIEEKKKPNLECWNKGDITVDDWDIVINDIKVANLGHVKSGAAEVCIYLSKDLNFNSNDILVKTLYLPALSPNYMAILDANIELMNKNIPTGEYYVGIVIDCDDDVMESNENDNICYFTYPKVNIKDPKKPDLECWNRGS
ncbi:MAG: CARDB domain-containing protein, partial [Bacteroidota bacterium]